VLTRSLEQATEAAAAAAANAGSKPLLLLNRRLILSPASQFYYECDHVHGMTSQNKHILHYALHPSTLS